jgi:hypothetical protein
MQSEGAPVLSQDMGSLLSEPSNVETASHMGQEDDELPPLSLKPPTQTSRSPQVTGRGQGAAKRARKSRITNST